MTTTHVFYALIPTIVLSQYVRSLDGRRLGGRMVIAALCYIAAIAVPLATAANWWIVVVTAAVIVGVDIAMLRGSTNRHLSRTLVLAFNIVVTIGVVGTGPWTPGFNTVTQRIIGAAARWNAVLHRFDGATVHRTLVATAGLLIATTEINHLIALVLKRSSLIPRTLLDTQKSGEDTPARGRMIGVLERGIVFVFTLTGNLSAIGLVLAAKAFARFRQLDDREFAEYMLIGTLLSISGAMAVGLTMRFFL
ncbi:MAG: hypothetical protein MI724_11835 [Spirochaetales bacterium]|nr:hypothetical protein [Spirochaetales bacterium]